MDKAKKIIQLLKENANEKDKQQWIRSIKALENVYGVKLKNT